MTIVACISLTFGLLHTSVILKESFVSSSHDSSGCCSTCFWFLIDYKDLFEDSSCIVKADCADIIFLNFVLAFSLLSTELSGFSLVWWYQDLRCFIDMV
uniref:NADH dehydrogenase subunit 3 n=1 Tax=Kalanchoe fedtschenkoi TaxID=63787 RepID=A0A7N0U0G9_KALFE